MMITFGKRKRKGIFISDLLTKHFGKTKPEDLSISERQFPYRVRADLQRGIEQVIAREKGLKRFCGLSQFMSFEGFDLSALISQNDRNQAMAVPPQYENGQAISSGDVQNALEEMLVSGGTLNVKLLGGNRRIGFELSEQGE